MQSVFGDYARDRVGWFFGLTGGQLATLAATVLPVFWAVHAQRWALAGALAGTWAVVALLVVVPVRGRSATGWLAALVLFLAGRVAGWSRFRSRAAAGRPTDLGQADLPGVLAGVVVHDGPPHGPSQARIAIIQDHAARTWAVTAAITHPGIGMADGAARQRYANGLADLLDVCARTNLIDEVHLMVRTVPDDGAERSQWLAQHRRNGSPTLARTVNDGLVGMLTRASVRTEAFLTLVVPESRLGREARQAGGGLDGRARILYSLIGEVEAQLRAGLAMTGVTWLTSPELALAVRTGFAPADRAGIIDARHAKRANSQVNDEVPWAMAGPSGAETEIRHYTHDAWNSISATVRLPDKGAALGALAPVLIPGDPGERRSLCVVFPLLAQSVADRQSANAEWAADMGTALRAKAGVRTRARDRHNTDKAYRLDDKLARGNALVRPYALACVTVGNTVRVGEYGRRLDAAIRRAGYAPLRLDLAQDAGFAAATIPLGVSLTRKSDR